MTQEINSTTITENYGQAFDKYFSKGDVFLRVHNGKIKVKYFGFTDGRVAVQIPQVNNLSGQHVMFCNIQGTMIYAYIKYLDKEEDNIFIFLPVRIQIISSGRDEDRHEVEGASKKQSLVFITNFVSDFMIQNSLALSLKKIDYIKDDIIDDLDNAFPYIKIHMANEGRSDARMKYFVSERIPIYIQDYTKEPSESERNKVHYYINNILDTDHYMKTHKELVSEISVPFLLNGKIPYGYLQINGPTPFSKETVRSVKQFAISANSKIEKQNLIHRGQEKLIVTNMSRNGFGVTFNDRKVIRYFKEKSLVSCDVIIPGGRKCSVLCDVKHITSNDNKTISVGFNMLDADALGEVYYQEFIEELLKRRQT